MGFLRGRQTSDATRRIVNVIHYAERTRTPSLLLSIDAEKAFDRVHWTYMEMTLNKFGFRGPHITGHYGLIFMPLSTGLLSRLSIYTIQYYQWY